MKIAVAGKGGVGKTLISASLARLLTLDGYKVLAVDADPNINLGTSLGIPREIANKIVPLSENEDLVKEKTGLDPRESLGVIFNMTPTVDDIIDRFGLVGPGGVKLLVMGTVQGGGTGCMCGANALLRVLIQHLLIQRGEVLIMDMVAGLEHLGRGTARRMDSMLVVIEPRMKSIDTVGRIMKMAEEIEVKEVLGVGNKISDKMERAFIEDKMGDLGIPVVTYVPLDPFVGEADMLGKALIDYKPESPAIKAITQLKDYLKKRHGI